MMGMSYLYGISVDSDEAEARRWYQRAADQGHADAQESLLRLPVDVDQEFEIREQV